MLQIFPHVFIPDADIELSAIRSQGAGGQNVNKVSSAIHLRFDIKASSLPTFYKQRLLQLSGQYINKDGVIIIKAQQHRTQEKNRKEAIDRLQKIIKQACSIKKTRHKTKPSFSSKKKRLDKKSQRGKEKALRKKVYPS